MTNYSDSTNQSKAFSFPSLPSFLPKLKDSSQSKSLNSSGSESLKFKGSVLTQIETLSGKEVNVWEKHARRAWREVAFACKSSIVIFFNRGAELTGRVSAQKKWLGPILKKIMLN